MMVADIQQFFRDNVFKESLLLQYTYDAKRQTVTLVCDYAHDVVMAVLEGKKPPLMKGNQIYHRDLRKLVFFGVDEYSRESGPLLQFRAYNNDFNIKELEGSIVIEAMHVMPADQPDKFRIDIEFMNFGRSAFTFRHVQAERKLVRSLGKKADKRAGEEDWYYIDIANRQPVDFYDPFSES